VMGQLTPDYDECGGTITQDWSYTDDCGRTITQQQIITVLPAPEAVFNGVQADEISCDAATTFTASSLGYTNNGLGGCLIEGSVMGQLTPDYDECGGTITQDWSYTDDCGRTITQQQIITVLPAPEAVFDTIDDIEILCENLDSFEPGSLGYSNNGLGGCLIEGSVMGVADPFDGNCGQFDVNFSYTDDCGRTITAKQVVTVTDNKAPVITCPEPQTICNLDFPESLDATWTDNCADGGPITAYLSNVRDRADGCAQLGDYVFTVSDGCGNETTETCTITREFDKIGECETAFARADEGAECFIPDFKRWGWTNYFECEGTYELPLYAGAAHCDVSKGTLVGTVTVDYTGGQVTVTYGDLAPGYLMTEAHVYVGCEPYPKNNGVDTVAPGQYPYNPSNLGNVQNYSVEVTNISGPIYVIAHAVTCEIVCMCSPSESDMLSNNEGGMVSFEGGFTCAGGGSCEPELVQDLETVDFKAYPVPFDQEVNINYSFDYDTDVHIDVFDMKGALIRSSENTQYIKGSLETTTIDLSGTDNQMFFVRITTREGTAIKKIVSSSPQ
ncbi:T9SS type A sorting domain-containing protein, partial [Aestuariivivens sediminis]|uniref:T9SS type A sorting domain-containing protein n=1 Tax=Aestuariivivens sediminis TaxID=2913557 RepID=UPI001F560742